MLCIPRRQNEFITGCTVYTYDHVFDGENDMGLLLQFVLLLLAVGGFAPSADRATIDRGVD